MFNIVNLRTVISLALSSQLIARNETLLKWETFWGEGQEKEDDHLQWVLVQCYGQSRKRQVESRFWHGPEIKPPHSNVTFLQECPSRRQQWKAAWRRAASRTGPLASNHRWHPQGIQTRRREMGVREVSGKPYLNLGRLKWEAEGIKSFIQKSTSWIEINITFA